MGQAPFGLTAGAEVIVAGFGGYNATIALRQTAETGVTVTLTETLARDSTAVGAFNLLQVLDLDALTQKVA